MSTRLLFDLNMNTRKISDTTEYELSKDQTEEEKQLSKQLSDYFCEEEREWLTERGLLRINFDIEKREEVST